MKSIEMDTDIFIKTPLMYSKPLSDITSREVYLKLENTQPSGSFKLRGLSHLCKHKFNEGITSFIGSSGGNAGLALAYSAWKLNVPCTIFVPDSVPTRMISKLKSYGAKVKLGGKNIKEAHEKALQEFETTKNTAYIHPFNNPILWDGHSKIIEEIKTDLDNRKPACIAVSVGGGGLLLGIFKGLEDCGWNDVPIVALETIGAECFHLSVQAGKPVEHIPTSIAKTLATGSVAPELMKRLPHFNVLSTVLPDKEAAKGCIRIADDHGFMVEPSCGVTMASVYSNIIPGILDNNGFNSRSGPIVLIVCGGSDISLEILNEFAEKYQ